MNEINLKDLTLKVLEDAFLMSLGTVDENGVWVSDVIYVNDDDFNIYWISLPQARHSKAIEKNKQVACTITASFKTGDERALQVSGEVEVLDGDVLEMAQKLEAKRGKEIPKVAGEILEKGHVWYKLKPTKIELINTELFGYKRQSVI